MFCISTTMPAAYWYVPRVTYVQKLHPTQVPTVVCCSFSHGEECGVAFLCRQYPCLASPGPSRIILSQFGVLACVLGFSLQSFVSIAPIELLPAF